MTNQIGIMQGRLSPPSPKRIQAFPWNSWEQEFAYARDQGVDSIEWLFEEDDYEVNPIMSNEGVERINELIEKHGVPVNSVCSDYFMPHPFFRASSEDIEHSISVLKQLIRNTAIVGAKGILIPVLEISEIQTEDDERQLIKALRECAPEAEKYDIFLGLETELPAEQYAELIRHIDVDVVGVYYDTGNAAAQGYDTASDVRVLGPQLCGVHIKDRELKGSTVPLGDGAVDFATCLAAVKEVGYTGTLVMQSYFASDFLGYAKTHAEFLRKLMAANQD